VVRPSERPEHFYNFFEDGIVEMTVPNQAGTDLTFFLKRFLRKPWREKFKTLSVRWYMLRRAIATIPLPVTLPFGILWVPRHEVVGEGVLAGDFETAEVAFVRRFLKPGMTVLDVGAHHGLYTLISSKIVGLRGRVFAFEPSLRERRALVLNVWLNKIKFAISWNVRIQGLAVGEENTETDLYVADDWAGAFNSLRPPNVSAATSKARVRVVSLDHWLATHKVNRVDFIKLDIEGAELSALRGARVLLQRRHRPVFLIEVYEVRTAPWGYSACEIVQLLHLEGYRWFTLSDDGTPRPVDADLHCYDANLVAVPNEGLAEFEFRGN
jgi:FkbM family methyltransferase